MAASQSIYVSAVWPVGLRIFYCECNYVISGIITSLEESLLLFESKWLKLLSYILSGKSLVCMKLCLKENTTSNWPGHSQSTTVWGYQWRRWIYHQYFVLSYSVCFHCCGCDFKLAQRALPLVSLISVPPPSLLSGLTQRTDYLLSWCWCFIPFFILHFPIGSVLHIVSVMLSHTHGVVVPPLSWMSQWHVCLPSWFLPPYCPPALCAGAFCVSLAGIGLFTVIKWEQRRLVDWSLPLLDWMHVAVHTAAL